jgi:hypothetical protein
MYYGYKFEQLCTEGGLRKQQRELEVAESSDRLEDGDVDATSEVYRAAFDSCSWLSLLPMSSLLRCQGGQPQFLIGYFELEKGP